MLTQVEVSSCGENGLCRHQMLTQGQVSFCGKTVWIKTPGVDPGRSVFLWESGLG